MEYNDMFKIVKELPFDREVTVYSECGIDVYLLRPSTLPKRFKGYDLKKNFQVWLQEGARKFRPNHLRIMIDLNLRIRSHVDLKRPLLKAFDGIYYRQDPEKAIENLKNVGFEHYLNPLGIIANITQLFIIEQDYNYNRESNFEPPTLFFQGWIRQFIDSPKEIDNLCMSVCNGQPPAVKYTSLENKKHKNFTEEREELWYMS